MLDWWEFCLCELGDAIEQTGTLIGKTLSQRIWQGTVRDIQGLHLKRAYEFWFCCKTDSGLVEVAFVPTADSPPHLVHESSTRSNSGT